MMRYEIMDASSRKSNEKLERPMSISGLQWADDDDKIRRRTKVAVLVRRLTQLKWQLGGHNARHADGFITKLAIS
jgi:hypothetical protein